MKKNTSRITAPRTSSLHQVSFPKRALTCFKGAIESGKAFGKMPGKISGKASRRPEEASFGSSVRKVFTLVCAAMLMLMLLVPLAACSQAGGGGGGDASTQVAATVNGVEIMEQKVTDYVQTYRKSLDAEEDEAWGKWLVQSGLTPESYRQTLVDLYVEQELVKQLAEKEGISMTEQAKTELESIKASYGSEEDFVAALEAVSYTEESYLALSESRLCINELTAKIAEEQSLDTVEDAQMLEYLQTNIANYTGAKRSSQILFAADTEGSTENMDLANDVMNRINNGELDFAAAVQEYSIDETSKPQDGDMGWDKITQLSSEYQAILDTLEQDQTSAPTATAEGIRIVRVTETYTAPETLESLDGIPEAIIAVAKEGLIEDNKSAAYSEWYADQEAEADIVINPIPSDVPYNIDITPYQEEADAAAQAAEDAANPEDAESTTEAAANEGAEGTEGDTGEGADGAENGDAGADAGADADAGAEGAEGDANADASEDANADAGTDADAGTGEGSEGAEG